MTQGKPSDIRWRFWIDRGGTFTDIVASDPDGMLHNPIWAVVKEKEVLMYAGIRQAKAKAGKVEELTRGRSRSSATFLDSRRTM